ncbi:MAG TPA: D-Ala-D-Ala carboxypeptidase family metallohydrolase [Gemmatimonadaceae bacterium]|nr:D-Ala-D-Ala carboxypeptidase family metallohydrolase [Gemmatimonadaceae bacterium]
MTSSPLSRRNYRPTDGWPLGRVAVIGVLAVGAALAFVSHPPNDLLASPFERGSAPDSATSVTPLASAFGFSGEVQLQLRTPGERFDFPMRLSGPSEHMAYQWIRAQDSTPVLPLRTLVGTSVLAPERPGFYHLSLSRPDGPRIVDSVLLGVILPFSAKLGSSLNGYRIGNYRWEGSPSEAAPPKGFIEVFPQDSALPVSAHLRLADFLSHDGQERWPRYLALDPRILDKVELVLRYLGSHDHEIPMDVHSGFRTPFYNLRVPRAASDSRHQYGDAADLAIDADGDGRVSYLDGIAVAHAVDAVERDHPQLTGGLGIYGSRGGAAYVHIDVRGARKRWRD